MGKYIKKTLKKIIHGYMNNMNEFYRPIIEAGCPIIL